MSISFRQIGEMAAAGDVAGLTRTFDHGDWDTRETVMQGFVGVVAPKGTAANLCDRWDDPALRQEVAAALREVLSRCNADAKRRFFKARPNSYRDNCINTAERWLETLDSEAQR